jgi:hypothetical protein
LYFDDDEKRTFALLLAILLVFAMQLLIRPYRQRAENLGEGGLLFVLEVWPSSLCVRAVYAWTCMR